MSRGVTNTIIYNKHLYDHSQRLLTTESISSFLTSHPFPPPPRYLGLVDLALRVVIVQVCRASSSFLYAGWHSLLIPLPWMSPTIHEASFSSILWVPTSWYKYLYIIVVFCFTNQGISYLFTVISFTSQEYKLHIKIFHDWLGGAHLLISTRDNSAVSLIAQAYVGSR